MATAIEQNIDALNHRIIDAGNRMSGTVEAQIEQLEKAADRSRNGNDSTGIAKCGELCKGSLNHANDLRRSFGNLLLPLSNDDPPASSPRQRFDRLQRALVTLEIRQPAYLAFCGREEIPGCGDTATELRNDSLYIKLADQFGHDTALDNQQLVNDKVIVIISKAVRGEAEPSEYLLIFVAMLTRPLSWAMVIYRLKIRDQTALSAIAKETNHLRSVERELEENLFANTQVWMKKRMAEGLWNREARKRAA